MSSEFSRLLDIALSRGYTRSQIIEEIKFKIFQLLKDSHPKSPLDCQIILDIDSGQVRIISEDKDITPKGFAAKAESLSRGHLINLISFTKPDSKPVFSSLDSPLSIQIFRFLANLFFWFYNLLAALWSLGYISYQATFNTSNITPYLFSFVSLLIPVSSIVLVISRGIYRNGNQLLKIFFLYEIPLLFLTVISSTIPTQIPVFLWFLVINVFIGTLLLLIRLGHVELSPKCRLVFSFFSTLVLLVWTYLCLLFTLLLPKIIAILFTRLNANFSFVYSQSQISGLFDLGGNLALFIFGLVLIFIPYLILYLLYTNFIFTRPAKHHLLFVLIAITIFLGFAYRPRYHSEINDLALLVSDANFSKKQLAAEKLLSQKEKLHQIITQLRTSRDQYIFTQASQIFANRILNQFFLTLAYPMVYQGPINTYDLQQAYNLLFATYTPEVSESKNVVLSYRKISYDPSPSGAVASVTIEEEYDNKSSVQQEVVYEFNLFPGSVITDLKLGADLEFSGQIAPKGAAQRTYQSQVRVNRDPALLEQIGSNTYRLRVFPIPSKNDFTTLKGKHQKISFTYVTTATPDGYPLPIYTRQTNISTTNATSYLQEKDGQSITMNKSDKYLPSKFHPCTDSLSDVLISLTCDQKLVVPQSKKMAVLFDISLRNRDNSNLSQLRKFAANYQFDLYFYNTEISEPLPITALDNPTYWGESNLPGVLTKFNRSYDVVFILSSSPVSQYNLPIYPFAHSTPVYVISAKNTSFSLFTLSSLYQAGGISTVSFNDAIYDYIQKNHLPENQFLVNKYFALDNLNLDSGPVGKLAQSRKISYIAQSYPTNILNNISELDKLHQLAINSSIVTPYSSLIALINDTQQEILLNQTNQYNRYFEIPARDTVAFTSPTTQTFPLVPPLELQSPKSSLFADITKSGMPAPTPALKTFTSGVSISRYSSILVLLLPVLVFFPMYLIYYLFNRK